MPTNEQIEAAQIAFHEADEAGANIDDCWLAALSAAEGNAEPVKASPWQPIETAPKDGSSVLCFVPLETMTAEFNHRILALRYESRNRKWLTDVYAFVPFDPTHWMPLPPTPEDPAHE